MFCQIEQFALTAIRLVFEVKKKKLKKNSGVYTQSRLCKKETNLASAKWLQEHTSETAWG